LDCCFAVKNFNSGQYTFFWTDSLEGLDFRYLEDGGGDGNGRGFSGHGEGLYLLSALLEKRCGFQNHLIT
jgi:hypothetical protein